jgi:alkaline phosphatase
MMNKQAILPLVLLAAGAAHAADRAKNVILFIADAGGPSTLHAASVHKHGEPAKLFIQRMPHLGWSDTSSASDWVSDSAAGMTAIVTGVKTQNGVISQGPSAIRGSKDGETLKTILEYAEEHGLSTGVVSNSSMADATPAACYAHVNDRKKAGEIFAQVWQPRFGDGVDVIFGPGRKDIIAGVQLLNLDLAASLQKAGYFFGESLAEVPADAKRAIVLTDDRDFDVAAAAEQAVRILSRNKKGFFLMIESDLHAKNLSRAMDRAGKLDDLVQKLATTTKDTLILFTADHSYDMRITGSVKRGEPFYTEVDGKMVLAKSVSVQGHHSAEQVLVAGQGPGAERVKGFMSNTDLFHVMMAAYGWKVPAAPRGAEPAVSSAR